MIWQINQSTNNCVPARTSFTGVPREVHVTIYSGCGWVRQPGDRAMLSPMCDEEELRLCFIYLLSSKASDGVDWPPYVICACLVAATYVGWLDADKF